MSTALTIVVAGAYLRGAMVVLAFLRTLLGRRRFVTFRMGWVEVLCLFEAPLLLAVTHHLHASLPDRLGTVPPPAAVAGAGLVAAGWALLVWSFLSWPSLFAGHGVLAGHRLVTRGAYGLVRHPVYLAAFLIWLGLAVGFASLGTLLVTLLYVIPVYLLYIRSEEQMLGEPFGDAYRDYRRRVPMLVPRIRRVFSH